jgi:predicted acylesterase/phospholipase RssA
MESANVGLALSGGGFRATLFHLGVTRALAEAGLLSHVSHITSVSGGSVLAAHLVLNWRKYCGTSEETKLEEFEKAAEPLLKFIEFDVRNRILRRLPWGIVTRIALRGFLPIVGRIAGNRAKQLLLSCSDRCTSVDILRCDYERLFGRNCLADLEQPGVPQLAILATEVASMSQAWFTARGFGQPADNPTDTRFVGRDLLTVAESVAGSSAFPALFPPVRLDGSIFLFDAQGSDRYVTDAGVYDNLGISGFLGAPFAAAVSPVLVSDATATSEWSAGTRLNILSNLLRSVDIIQQRAAELQRRTVGLPQRDTLAGTAAPEKQSSGRFVLFDIAQEDIVLEPKVSETMQAHLSYVRTDFDTFSSVEIRGLVQHGYSVAWHGLQQMNLLPSSAQSRFSEWRDRWPRPRPACATSDSEVAEIKAARRSHMRLFSFTDYVGVLNALVSLIFLLTPLLLWEIGRVRAAHELSEIEQKRAMEKIQDDRERSRRAEERIAAYLNFELPTFTAHQPFLYAPNTGDPRYDGLVINSLDKVFDLRKWVRVPAESRDSAPLEAANQQTVYYIHRDNRLTHFALVLKTTGIDVVPDVPTFPSQTLLKVLPNAQDHYFKHVLLDVNISGIPPQTDFPLVVRSTYWNAFQKDIEDASFKVYTSAPRATMVVLFPTERLPAKFNFWQLKRDGDNPQLIQPAPFYIVENNGLFFEIQEPKEGYTYGVAFSWDDRGGTGALGSVTPTLDAALKPAFMK